MTERNFERLFTWRSAIQDSGLPPDVRHIALSLSLHMNERGGSCFPSIETLRKETGRRKASVIDGLKMLEATGWLSVLRGGGRGNPNRYSATIPKGYEGGTVYGDEELGTELMPGSVPETVPETAIKGTDGEPVGRKESRSSVKTEELKAEDQPSAPEEPDEEDMGRIAPAPAPSDRQVYFAGRLWDHDEAWKALTFGAVVKLNKKHGGPTVAVAMGRVWEEAQGGSAPPKSPFALLDAICSELNMATV